MIVAVLPQGTDPGPRARRAARAPADRPRRRRGHRVQHRDRPDRVPTSARGKVEELKAPSQQVDAEVVVTEDELSPSQQRRLEDALQMRVVDRTAVILDIFADHAADRRGQAPGRARPAAVQPAAHARACGSTSSASAAASAPAARARASSRPTVAWPVTGSRCSSGGCRGCRPSGPGCARSARARRCRRSPWPATRTSGKSTLLNALTGAEVSSANRLFETLDPTTRAFEHLGRAYVVTDTVGFIRKLPHGLVEAFASTLEETLAGDLILLVADASADEDELGVQQAAVETVLHEIGADQIPRLLVLNKIDRCDEVARRRLLNRAPDAVLVSARTGENLDVLRARIGEHFAGRFERVELLVPHDEGALLAQLYALGSPIEREDEPEGVRIRAHLPIGLIERYAAFRVAPTPARKAARGEQRGA